MYRKYTCIRWVPKRRSHDDYVYIYRGIGCHSAVGRSGNGRQDLSLGNNCVHLGVVVHEMMHAVGFWHEQSRPDRDKYVKIYLGNVQRGMEFNFDKKRWSEVVVKRLGKYDYASVMHYPRDAFSRTGAATIVPLKKRVNI